MWRCVGLDNIMKKEISFPGILKKIAPRRLIKEGRNDGVENFFLVLGLIYNDLKNLHFHIIQTKNFFDNSNKTEVTINSGEEGGIIRHLERLVVSTVAEFFEFLYKNREVLETKEFQLLLQELNQQQRDYWGTLVEISKRSSGSIEEADDFVRILISIRGSFTFHYYNAGNALRKGFIDFFYKQEKKEVNKQACFSFGASMSETRFFYCDAAAMTAYFNQIERVYTPDDFTDRILEIIKKMTFTMSILTNTYIKKRPY